MKPSKEEKKKKRKQEPAQPQPPTGQSLADFILSLPNEKRTRKQQEEQRRKDEEAFEKMFAKSPYSSRLTVPDPLTDIINGPPIAGLEGIVAQDEAGWAGYWPAHEIMEATGEDPVLLVRDDPRYRKLSARGYEVKIDQLDHHVAEALQDFRELRAKERVRKLVERRARAARKGN